jgi:uncharacterized protein YfaS (alpha-2-macroglobulin family)
MKVSVYQYGDAQAYIAGLKKREKIPYWAYCTRDKYLEDTTKLAQVTSFTTKLKQYGFESFLEFPQPLSPGYYLGQVSLGNLVRQVWFQITDLAVYTTVTKNNTLIWVNDLETGKPVSNGLIDILGSEKKAATDPKGLAQIASPQGAENGIYFTVKYQNKEVAASVLPNWSGPMAGDGSNALAAPENYWKYFYLDRGLYQPSDTVQFWGLIKPRDGDQQDPRQVTIALMKSQEGPDNVLIDSKQVKVSGNVFSGDFKLPNLIPGYYQLAVKVEDQVIANRVLMFKLIPNRHTRLTSYPIRKLFLQVILLILLLQLTVLKIHLSLILNCNIIWINRENLLPTIRVGLFLPIPSISG